MENYIQMEAVEILNVFDIDPCMNVCLLNCYDGKTVRENSFNKYLSGQSWF